MPPPVAVVTVTIQSIDSVDASVLGSATKPYFLASIQGRRIGRSRAVPTSASSFDFTAEPQPWSRACAVGLADAVAVSLTLFDDQGDAGSTQLATITGSVSAPWLPGTTTFNGPNGEVVTILVATVYPIPAGPVAAVPRVADGTQDLATLAVPDVVAITFEDVLGLYKPTPGDPDTRSIHVDPTVPPNVPYASEDDLGRIFLHRDYQKAWVAHHHQIELHVAVTALWGEVPPGAKVLWTVIDPDDPTNDDPGFHAQWGPVVDANDYDSSGNQTGARPGDNYGTRAGDTFVEVPGYALSGKTKTSAKTEIVAGESQVTFTGTNAAGDNFVVLVSLDGAPDAVVLTAQTGIMTMWHQLDLEVGKMPDAFDLPVDQLHAFYAPLCVQWDPHERSSPVDDVSPLAPDLAHYHAIVEDFVPAQFEHLGQKGWFCLIAAKLPFPPPAQPPAPPGGWPNGDTRLWWNGRTGGDHLEWFDLPGSFPGMMSAKLTWTPDGETEERHAVFELSSCVPWVTPDGTQLTRFFIDSPASHGMTHEFKAKDGSTSNAYVHFRQYYPQGYISEGGSFVADTGYRVPHLVHATVAKSAPMVAGTSPAIKNTPVGDCFGGRTIVFTHHPGLVVSDPATHLPVLDANGNPTPNDKYVGAALVMMTHELGHAFGMPHICGFHDWHAPRDKTCTMNYPLNWMRDYTTHHLIPNTDRKSAADFCGLHLREIRRTDLTKNVGLGWT